MPESLASRAHLERVFRFDALDLAANQAGQLGQAQRDYLAESRAAIERAQRSGPYLLVGLGILALVYAAVFLNTMLSHGRQLSDAIASAAVFALSGAGTIVWGLCAKAMSSPLFLESVQSVEGEISFEEEDDDGWPTMPIFHVGGLKFVVSSDAQAALKDGERYRIHYIRTSTPTVMGSHVALMILSVEASESLHT